MNIKRSWLMLLAFIPGQQSLAEVVTDGSLGGPAQVFPGPTYFIDSTLGQTVGSNLFHSFAEFNIAKGETVSFQSIDSIHNIFARVTGGHLSTINGEVNGIGNTNLWLINPAGWLIGKDASINVNGAFHLTTATSIDFQRGGQFLADPKNQSSLSFAEPIDYQFQNAKPATITIDQASLTLKPGAEISLVGGDINLKEAHIQAQGGRILLASNAGSEGKWVIGDGDLFQTNGQKGTINIDHSQRTSITNPSLSINEPTATATLPERSGNSLIQLTADKIDLNNAFISARSTNFTNRSGGAIELKGQTINLAHSTLSTAVFGSQNGGNISIKGNDLTLTGIGSDTATGSRIIANNNVGSTGNSGDINLILTGALNLTFQSGITSIVNGNGQGGVINVHSNAVNLDNKSFFSAATFGKGNAGAIYLTSQDLNLSRQSFLEDSTALGSDGNGGNITIASQHISLQDYSVIVAGSAKGSTGTPGNVNINPVTTEGESTISNTAFLKLQQSQISTSNNSSSGDGGNISVNTGSLVMNGGYVQANSLAANGNGGKVTVNAARSLVGHEQLEVGGNIRRVLIQEPNRNVIQAAAPFGESGQVNVSKVELNIAGQLAKVDANFANNRPVGNDPCSVQRGESTSSLVQSGNGGLPPNARDAVSLPLTRLIKTNDTASAEQANTAIAHPTCDKDKH